MNREDVIDFITEHPNVITESLERYADMEKENAKLLKQVSNLKEKLRESKVQEDFLDITLKDKRTMSMTSFANLYGVPASKINEELENEGVQVRHKSKWNLTLPYQLKGYEDYKNNPYKKGYYMVWTQKGRIFLYNFLKEKGIYPLMEQEDNNE